MTTLSDMPMITIEQKNRFREAALKVEAERDELAAHVVELVKGGRALHDELQQWSLTERDPETSAAMAKWRTVVGEQPSLSPLYRLAAHMKAEALEAAVELCVELRKGQESLEAKYIEIDAEGEPMVVRDGINYANKALGISHCIDRLGGFAAEYRKQVEG